MGVIIFRTLAILSIIVGFILRMKGFDEGDTLMKMGIATIIVIVITSLIRISPNSRGTL